jgi:hypothetical protein
MALYSLVIEREGKTYSTQLAADSAAKAVKKYFNETYPRSSVEIFGESTPKLTAKDIIYVTPMDGLVNMWVACAGREGKYVSVICARTVSRQAT